jgi:hypothetical protein
VLALVNSIGVKLGAVDLRAARPDRWHDEGFAATAVFADFRDEATQVVAQRDFSSNGIHA